MPEALTDRYMNKHDVDMRLGDSWVRIDRKIYHVSGVYDNLNLDLRDINGDKHVISANDPKLNISSLPPRYIFDNKNTYYLSRYPYRRQKQPICSSNSQVIDVILKTSKPHTRLYYYYNENAYNFTQNIYDSLCSGVYNSYPISPQCVIKPRKKTLWSICYKEDSIGYIDHNKQEILIDTDLVDLRPIHQVKEVLKYGLTVRPSV